MSANPQGIRHEGSPAQHRLRRLHPKNEYIVQRGEEASGGHALSEFGRLRPLPERTV